MKRLWLFSLVIMSILFAACAPAAPADTAAPAEEAAPAEAAEAGEAVDFITWYQYDQANEDPLLDCSVQGFLVVRKAHVACGAHPRPRLGRFASVTNQLHGCHGSQ